jgi:hypothetical protein
MATELMVQVKLTHGTTVLTCWLDKHVKVGDQVTLRNSDAPEWQWDVVAVYERAMRPEHGWHVGGM